MGYLAKITDGGVELDGYVSVPAGATAVVAHFHGLAGNFYENTFILRLESVLNEMGIGFASLNTRGHDYLADVVQGDEWISKGAAHTLGREYMDDIRAWASWLGRVYQLPIILQGHSAAAVSVGALMTERSVPNVIACVYISPADMVRELRSAVSPERFVELRRLAEARVEAGEDSLLMPEDSLDGYLLDSRVYLEMTDSSPLWGSFSLENPLRTHELLSIRPSLVVFGGEELASDAEIGSALDSWVAEGANVVTIPGAAHSYRGYEADLALSVADFVGGLRDHIAEP